MTLTHFLTMPIIRSGPIAEIIFDQTPEGPVRLFGFQCPAEWSDFEIAEEGLRYYLELEKTLTATPVA